MIALIEAGLICCMVVLVVGIVNAIVNKREGLMQTTGVLAGVVSIYYTLMMYVK